ncbi:hypothetical protein F0562_011733 [Nyssa sinensis]|uniref:Pentacotripeptide-repeat region of PRORP domain-containing protein n=1 Tax=Nyssa sinensis TaxID=561372 RepID=A0A5J4ZTE0_9ASTE|nr:hypothetical protein F0562_011733 [Nyssa sinensis]
MPCTGQAKESLQFFVQMNVKPDATTFVALLSACSHAGMVEEGTKIFGAMFENYGIAPQLDHFACMVDILGRAGKILEAEKLIRKMPMEPDSVVWSAMLGACGSYNDAGLVRKEMKGLGVRKKPGLSWIEIGNWVHEFASGGQQHPQGEAIRANLEELVGQLKNLGLCT